MTVLDWALPVVERARLLLMVPLLAGCLALGVTYLIAPTYRASTTFLAPPQQQSSAALALASLTPLSGLAGVSGAGKSLGDQYVSLLKSVSVADRLIDSFNLMEVYDVKYRFKAREELMRNVRVSLGKRDGLITVTVDDESPQRVADLANRHVDELRRLAAELTLTEAQQRRAFFETHLKDTRSKLVVAQQALEKTGFSVGALRAEPKAAAEGFAKLKAEVTAAEVRLQTLRQALSDNTSEVQRQVTQLAALRGQLAKLESGLDTPGETDYVGKYREFKYQEMLFEFFSRQHELARMDESKESLIQVIDRAMPPERRAAPARALTAIGVTVATFLALVAFVLVRHAWSRKLSTPVAAAKMERLRVAFRSLLAW